MKSTLRPTGLRPERKPDRNGDPSRRERASASGGRNQKAATFGTKKLPVPKDSYIEEMTSADDRLILRMRLKDGSCRIIALDLNTGAHLGTIYLTEET